MALCMAGCAILNRDVEDLANQGGRKQKEKSQQKSTSVISSGSEQLAYIYNPYITTIHPKVFVKKNNLDDIDLYVLINDNELLFSKANAPNMNMASIRIFYKIMESYENSTLIDSCQRVVSVMKSDNPRTYSIKLKLKPVELDKFVVQTTVTDMTRGKMNIAFTEVDKKNPYCSDNFMVTHADNMQPYPERYTKPGNDLRISYLCPKEAQLITLGTLPPDTQIPLNPYASDPAVEDSTLFNNITKAGLDFSMQDTHEGLYMATADTNFNQNLVIPCFGGDFPNINTPEEMLKPLAYLTTPEEFNALVNAKNKKLSVDEFWYGCSHDLKKAKEQIKIYYTRAIYANIYFTDYRKGMFTDRGMLYIVMGPPKMLAITSDSEIWTYKDNRSGQKVKFVFRKRASRLNGSNYVLRRSTEYKTYWDKAVKTWRSGNIYSF